MNQRRFIFCKSVTGGQVYRFHDSVFPGSWPMGVGVTIMYRICLFDEKFDPTPAIYLLPPFLQRHNNHSTLQWSLSCRKYSAVWLTSEMTSPFVPVAVSVERTLPRPGSSRFVGSLSSSPESPRSHCLWMRGSDVGCIPSLPFQPLGSQALMIQRGFEQSNGVFSNVESSSSRDNWEDRPPIPTLLGYEVMEERSKFTVGDQRKCNVILLSVVKLI